MIRKNAGELVLLAAVLACIAPAQTPGTAFVYQGRLQNAGVPANGTYDLRFRLWLNEVDPNIPNPIGPVICRDDVAVTDGLFNTQLDFGTNVFLGFPLWLEIEVRADATPGNCAAGGAYQLLTPRQPLKPAPYAVFATSAQTAGLRLPFDGTSNSGILLHLTNTSNAQNTSTGFFENFSTGANSRALTAYANGGSGQTYGVYTQNNSTSGIGLYAASFGTAAVMGHASNTSGVTYGGHFESAAGNGYGVFGHATATSGSNFGVYGRSDSPTGRGVHGYAAGNGGVNYGVYGRTDSTSGRAVFGEATTTSGTTYGGRFHSVSPGGYGVYGLAGAASGTTYGVYGESHSPSGYGVYGQGAEDGIGVYGVASGGAPFSTSAAICGEMVDGAALFSYAGLFLGDVRVTDGLVVVGDFAVGGTKSFKIDHPTDPANKYLVHYCSEAPEPLNAYRGNVVLDNAGRAWVDLPEYFEEINRDASFTLTPIGGPAPSLHVAAEVQDNRFQIAGGQPGQKVSWRVEAVRNDAWMRAHSAPVEIDKQEGERGLYLHPDLYGQPPEKGLNHNARRQQAAAGQDADGPAQVEAPAARIDTHESPSNQGDRP